MGDESVTVPTGTPPAALNSLMKLFLRTPGLQRWLGKEVALLTFTGRRTGKRYTIPISYDRQGDTVVMITKKVRRWWRNFETHPDVELRLAGKQFEGKAVAGVGTESELGFLISFLEHRPVDAKAYGVEIVDGSLDPEDARALLPLIVLVRVTVG